MRIYDCFKYNGEDLLLELRIKLLWDVVDFFCVVEAGETHSGNKKNQLFLNFIERHDHLNEKIRYYFIDKLQGDGPWQRENFQRNCLSQLYSDAVDDDLIIISDLDEILNPDCIIDLKNQISALDHDCIIHFKQYMLNYKFNFLLVHDQNEPEDFYKWLGPVATKDKTFTPQVLRNMRHGRHKYKSMFFENGGWHLSNFGDSNFFKTKISSFAESYKADVQLILRHWDNNENYIEEDIRNKIFNPKDRFWTQCSLEDIYTEKFIKNLNNIIDKNLDYYVLENNINFLINFRKFIIYSNNKKYPKLYKITAAMLRLMNRLKKILMKRLKIIVNLDKFINIK